MSDLLFMAPLHDFATVNENTRGEHTIEMSNNGYDIKTALSVIL